ncbi:NAD(P)-binding protein [Astrocystis sublimbata]|nr:NAD(P)-binding protein [Astrocystis sublimbata]KAI0191078.1 NAD(P)-binding protein [Astrocystis sublimbata]
MSLHLESRASFEATIVGFLCRQFTRPKSLPAGIGLSGQTAVVTGSNVGLGLETCRQLLEKGLSCLVMGVRLQAKGEAAASELRNQFPDSKIIVWTLDMESYDSIRIFSEHCDGLDHLDIVILNAGLISTSYVTVSATGNELTTQVNYLSTVLLTLYLLPVLKAKGKASPSGRPPVLTVVNSDRAYQVGMETHGPVLSQLNSSDRFNSFDWYGKSKLLLTMFIFHLSTITNPEDTILNMVNPGMTKSTQFFRQLPSVVMRLVEVGQWILARDVQTAASTYLDAIFAHGKESYGSFLSDWEIKPYPAICCTGDGREMKARLWDETLEEVRFAGVSKIVADLTSH